jgi:thymidylate kinase
VEAKCGGEINIPPKENCIYQWCNDLLKPSAVIFLELSERDRLLRMRERGDEETNEE